MNGGLRLACAMSPAFPAPNKHSSTCWRDAANGLGATPTTHRLEGYFVLRANPRSDTNVNPASPASPQRANPVQPRRSEGTSILQLYDCPSDPSVGGSFCASGHRFAWASRSAPAIPSGLAIMDDYVSESDSDYTSYWRDWVSLSERFTWLHAWECCVRRVRAARDALCPPWRKTDCR